MTKKKARLSGMIGILGTMALVGAVAPQAPAAAESSDPGIVTIVDQPGVVTVTIPDPKIKDKGPAAVAPENGDTPQPDSGPGQAELSDEPAVDYDPEYQPDPEGASAASRTGGAYSTLSAYVGNNSASHCSINFPPCKFNIYKSASRTITPPGGKSGLLKSYGKALVDVYTITGCCFTKADYYNTTSYSQWGGTSPYNATSIKHRDVWDIDYFALSWSFGGSPSGTVNHGSGRISYSNTVKNTWRVNHSVQHVYLKVSSGRVSKVKYEVHGSYGFGSNFYTTDAYSSVALP
ncbi:hypothetical protein O3597_23120 [Verrucosispora sp. WMMA2044]|uniref:Uncharacterized protein n=1 Tax=Verrucosispora sioxanthis TaxID=2499994 RepID=A0A6M1KU69_9ACTN|nr:MULTISPECIES: hypothetical protein [Micromonospora]NEE63495.1 hypothetical protein [Verrucosispora sioxanthis]NGM12605.1 hypothetical protein [Verrucosispora sioxanthis]WBB47978.1 hypothetical protein O3597_23120 [Verrucosispora sp. WMMA2044]